MFQGFAARCLIVEDIHSDIITLRPNAPWYSEEIRKQKSTYASLKGLHYTPSHTNVWKFFNFQHTFSQLILHLKS